MRWVCQRSGLTGDVRIPGSKSHTIRAVAIAALADGTSRIAEPLDSLDARAAASAYGAMGATIDLADPRVWTVAGTGGDLRVPQNVIDVGNSGTTLRVALGSAALLREGLAVFTGDYQIRRRPSGPLAESLTDLGANVESTRGNGSAPFVVRGRLRGGETHIDAVTSQYLSSLLINAPLGDGDSVIRVGELNERPYVEITLAWLDAQGIRYDRDEMREFRIPGGQRYRTVDRAIPADFSSATFFLAAGALPGNRVTSLGLDMNDSQGDKAIVDHLGEMGARVEIADGAISVSAHELRGIEIDLNATPDALPMMAVLGCFASGTTRLLNVPQARLKETDRIAVMAGELAKMGARVEELPDGLIVHESTLTGTRVSGHEDHRVVMALAVAGLAADGETEIDTAEAADVTFPDFADVIRGLGGRLRPGDEPASIRSS